MRVIGAFFALVCAALGGVQVWAGSRRRTDEFYILRSTGRSGLLSFELATTPMRLDVLIAEVGERGRDIVVRCLEIDHLVTAGYMFACLGMGGVLTAVHRSTLGTKVVVFGLIATLFGVIGNVMLRKAADTFPDGARMAPVVTGSVLLKWLFLGLAALCVLVWPVRTFLH
jgi:hypothetical protein